MESSLEHLHLPNITDQSVFEICDKLTAVDIIHFETKNISCLLLVEATNLNEGIDVNDPDHKIGKYCNFAHDAILYIN